MAGTTSDSQVASGSGDHIAEYVITEGGITRKLQRNVLSDSAGNELSAAGYLPTGSADGAHATIGVTTGTAVITDIAGTMQQYLRGLVKLFAAAISGVAGALFVKIADGSGNLLTSTGNVLDVNIKSGVNNNGPATPALSAPVVQAATTTAAAATPTVTASAYTAGNVMGGIMTFASLLDSVRFAGILESITVKFKGTAVTGAVTLNLFKASPSNGTYTDKAAPTWNAADAQYLLGSYVLPTPVSNLGTMTTYNLDGIAKAIQGATQSLYGVLTVAGTPTPASTTDLTVELAVLPG